MKKRLDSKPAPRYAYNVMNKTRKVTFRISDEQWRAIRQYALDHGVTAQEMFDTMLAGYMTVGKP